MTGHKDFFEGRVTIEKGTMSEGVTEKDTRIGFEIGFEGIIGTQHGKHKQPKTWSLDGSGALLINFSK